jgi:hypothetical protein
MSDRYNTRYRAVSRPQPHGTVVAPVVSIDLLETEPKEIKAVTKRYLEEGDSCVLALTIVDDKIEEKSMTYKVPWDLDMCRSEIKKGATVGFKWWENKGLELHLLTYLGSILVGKMVTLTVESKITHGHLFPTNWRDEIETEIAFPAVSVSKIELNDGYSKVEKENPRMALFYFEDIVMLLMNDDENKREEDELRLLSKKGIMLTQKTSPVTTVVRTLVSGSNNGITSLPTIQWSTAE